MGNTYSNVNFLLLIKVSPKSPHIKKLIPFVHAIYEINGKTIPSETETVGPILKKLFSEETLELKIANIFTRKKEVIVIKRGDESLGISVKPVPQLPNFLCCKPLNLDEIKNNNKLNLNKFDLIIGIEGVYLVGLENFYRYLFENKNNELNFVILNTGKQSVRIVRWKVGSEFNFLGVNIKELSEKEKIFLSGEIKELYNENEQQNEDAIEDIIDNKIKEVIHIKEHETNDSEKNTEIKDKKDSEIKDKKDSEIKNKKDSEKNKEPKTIEMPIPPKNKIIKNEYTIPAYPGQKPIKIPNDFKKLTIKNTLITKNEIKKEKEKQANLICEDIKKEKLITNNYQPVPEIISAEFGDQKSQENEEISVIKEFDETILNKKKSNNLQESSKESKIKEIFKIENKNFKLEDFLKKK